jgi:predicted nuclease with RNAse H fold
MVYTAGVDLAADTKKTAVATIRWAPGHARVERLVLGASDDLIVDIAADVDAMGIDCAFGWPDDFVDFVGRHARGERVDLSRDSGTDWRRRLAYRETDREVLRRTGRSPLSVATDRLGLTAMHCAALLDAISERIGPVRRSGSGPIVEVYPGAALRLWGLSRANYKIDSAVREASIADLRRMAPWLDLEAVESDMMRSDDAFDAVIAALIARARAIGGTHEVPPTLREQADREGWIALPSVGLESIVR